MKNEDWIILDSNNPPKGCRQWRIGKDIELECRLKLKSDTGFPWRPSQHTRIAQALRSYLFEYRYRRK